ncbi:MOSC domain-containing protein [Spirosoma sp. HMF4905]|uniref:MOSC domain-containing protein n=1 Tax=Spirosoma arboris TaxID=2682092 RepID=A0A7K1S722_9BACT|nr:MOSC domain-containing protein [Spirosoma arboris]MVM29633.1 MOSC domain-containing protein [Spirosoma arboris]
MHILSVNVGLPRSVQWGGRTITTGFYKQPASGPVSLELLNFVGDRQADLIVHGGPDKAVYAYDDTHYAHWRHQINREDWTPGLFGENLTTSGLLESEVRMGDLFRIGSALLRAVQPRFPCYKLNVRFDDPGMTRHFAREGRSGIYFRVVEPGVVQAGDDITLIEEANTTITIQTVSQIVLTRKVEEDVLASLIALPYLPQSLKMMFGQ